MIVKSSHLAAIAIGLAIGGFAFGCMHSGEHAEANSAPVAAAPAPAAPAAAAQVDAARLVGADKDPGNWMIYGRTYSEQRFSPLTKINADNVKNLGLAWYYDLDTDRGQEATPVVVDGVMYITTAWSMVKAFDAKTGKLLWDFDPKVGREILIHVCCDAVNRGVAVWKGKVYVGTIDGRLIALDAATGKPVWSAQTTDRDKPYTITSAPRAINDKIVIGNSGSSTACADICRPTTPRAESSSGAPTPYPAIPPKASRVPPCNLRLRPGVESGGRAAAVVHHGVASPMTRTSI